MNAHPLRAERAKRQQPTKGWRARWKRVACWVKMDETTYLLNTDANREALQQSLAQADGKQYKKLKYQQLCR